VWLAGGITAANAAAALHAVAPAGLDVASGAERPGDPRRKDPAAIAALASICKNHPAP
jgi:phosphoribosylanthranilate isomerase